MTVLTVPSAELCSGLSPTTHSYMALNSVVSSLSADGQIALRAEKRGSQTNSCKERTKVH